LTILVSTSMSVSIHHDFLAHSLYVDSLDRNIVSESELIAYSVNEMTDKTTCQLWSAFSRTHLSRFTDAVSVLWCRALVISLWKERFSPPLSALDIHPCRR